MTHDKKDALLVGGLVGSALITVIWWLVTGAIPAFSLFVTCVLFGVILAQKEA